MALVLPAMQHEPQHSMPPPVFTLPPGAFVAPGPVAPPPYLAQTHSFQNAPPQQPGHAGRGRQQQSQRQQKGLGPRTSRGKKRRRNKGREQPSLLAALSTQNRLRAQQHFGGPNDTPASEAAPRTVPHAPHNSNSFILNQHSGPLAGKRFNSPAMTPSEPSGNMQWTPSHQTPASSAADYSSLDKDAADLGAQLDFFGTNEGLVARYSSEDDSTDGEGSEDDGDEQHGWHLRLDEQEALQGLPSHVRARLASQAAYIAQLEQDNLDLQEKYSLLQHELEESRAAARTMAATGAVTPSTGAPAS